MVFQTPADAPPDVIATDSVTGVAIADHAAHRLLQLLVGDLARRLRGRSLPLVLRLLALLVHDVPPCYRPAGGVRLKAELRGAFRLVGPTYSIPGLAGAPARTGWCASAPSVDPVTRRSNGRGVTCVLPTDLPNGTAATVSIVVQPSGAGTITSAATATATRADPVPGNNSDRDVTRVMGR